MVIIYILFIFFRILTLNMKRGKYPTLHIVYGKTLWFGLRILCNTPQWDSQMEFPQLKSILPKCAWNSCSELFVTHARTRSTGSLYRNVNSSLPQTLPSISTFCIYSNVTIDIGGVEWVIPVLCTDISNPGRRKEEGKYSSHPIPKSETPSRVSPIISVGD